MPDGIELFSQPTGTYTFAAFFADRVSSNISSYHVEEPNGADAAVLRQLKEIGSKYDIQRVVAAVDQLENILNLNPNSIYSPQILKILQGTHNTIRTRNYAKVVEYGRRLIEEYPDSYEVEFAFDGLVQVMKREEWFTYLTQVESTRAGTRAARRAHALQSGVGPLPIDLGGGK
jgi:outer membrane protein assembly factor BamD (BamD/ComL family)